MVARAAMKTPGPPLATPAWCLGANCGNCGRVGQSPVSLGSPVPGVDSAERPNQCGA
jgi:hypothetical protein